MATRDATPPALAALQWAGFSVLLVVAVMMMGHPLVSDSGRLPWGDDEAGEAPTDAPTDRLVAGDAARATASDPAEAPPPVAHAPDPAKPGARAAANEPTATSRDSAPVTETAAEVALPSPIGSTAVHLGTPSSPLEADAAIETDGSQATLHVAADLQTDDVLAPEQTGVQVETTAQFEVDADSATVKADVESTTVEADAKTLATQAEVESTTVEAGVDSVTTQAEVQGASVEADAETPTVDAQVESVSVEAETDLLDVRAEVGAQEAPTADADVTLEAPTESDVLAAPEELVTTLAAR